MNTWGNKIKLSIFGESHGTGVGIVVDGIPSGVYVDMDFIQSELNRRKGGQSPLSTPRKEDDELEILSGILNGFTTGTPICAIVRNSNCHSKDYSADILRPGHADLTGFAKYGEFHDFRGGGHFSGRITIGLVFAGAIAKLVLRKKGIVIGSHIKKLYDISEESFLDIDNLSPELLEELSKKSFPVINSDTEDKMRAKILESKEKQDSVGGVLECAVMGIPQGLGSPFFASLESTISSMMFSIPGVKGIEFGRGFGMSDLYGSQANDAFRTDGEKIYTLTNNNGGINGGISNGMPIVFSVAVKPTPSISLPQLTVNKKTMENTTIQVNGRHDPCILSRAAVIVECSMALCILEG